MKLVNGDSMNEEPKEILEGMQKANDEDKNLWLENTSVKLLYSYITNLQERKITKEDVDKYFEENMCVSFDKFIENWNEQKEWTNYYKKEYENYKSRCEKAIKWIDKHTEIYTKNGISIIDWDNFSDPRNLKNILGGDEE